MKKMVSSFDIYNPHSNKSVTEGYVSIIEHSLNDCGFPTTSIDTLLKSKSNKEKGIVVIESLDAIKARAKGYKTIIVWIQGAVGYESFMRHKNPFRLLVINLIQCISMRISSLILFCSDYMKSFYRRRLYFTKGNYYIMPCFNENIDLVSIDMFPEKKQMLNQKKTIVFTYAGSLAKWQCFEETAVLYKAIERVIPNSLFKVFVQDKQSAEAVLRKYGIERFTIDFVKPDELSAEMRGADFGFCIRKDSVVNRVATPTKLSSYVCNGVIPIYSNCLRDFDVFSEKSRFLIKDDSSIIGRIYDLCSSSVCKRDVIEEFKRVFKDYYSCSFHQNQLVGKIRDIIGERHE